MRIAPLCLILTLGLLVGCSALEPPAWHERTDEGRHASFEPYVHLQVQNVPLDRFVAHHTVVLYGDAELTLERREGNWRVHQVPISSEHRMYRGLAVPLTADGYFLTASHTLWGENLTLHLPREENPLVPARVVWQSQAWERPDAAAEVDGTISYDRDTDLAIIHAPVHWDRAPAWADVNTLEAGTPLVAGTPKGDPPIAGEFLDRLGVHPPDMPISMEWFLHAAPTRQGDSGGPLMLTDGRLLGINVGGITAVVHHWLAPWGEARELSVAVAPDFEAVMRIIENDRAAFANRQP